MRVRGRVRVPPSSIEQRHCVVCVAQPHNVVGGQDSTKYDKLGNLVFGFCNTVRDDVFFLLCNEMHEDATTWNLAMTKKGVQATGCTESQA